MRTSKIPIDTGCTSRLPTRIGSSWITRSDKSYRLRFYLFLFGWGWIHPPWTVCMLEFQLLQDRSCCFWFVRLFCSARHNRCQVRNSVGTNVKVLEKVRNVRMSSIGEIFFFVPDIFIWIVLRNCTRLTGYNIGSCYCSWETCVVVVRSRNSQEKPNLLVVIVPYVIPKTNANYRTV